jgi:hypothetical protein
VSVSIELIGVLFDGFGRRGHWRFATRAWHAMYERACQRWSDQLEPLGLAPSTLATLITVLFLGSEIEYLAGIPDEELRVVLFDAIK